MVHAPYLHDPRFEAPGEVYRGPLAGLAVDEERVIQPFLRGELDLGAEDKAYVDRLYDAGVARADESVGRFLEGLFSRVDPRRCLVILTSDHGEELFEHGSMAHGHTVHAEQLRIPLVVQAPGQRLPRTSDRPVSLLDIVPTVLDAAGLRGPAGMPGTSLLGLLPEARVRMALDLELDRAVQYLGYKLILPGEDPPLLFRTDRDPWERADLAAEQPERVADLLRVLARYEDSHPPSAAPAQPLELDAQTAASLQALGYLGDG